MKEQRLFAPNALEVKPVGFHQNTWAIRQTGFQLVSQIFIHFKVKATESGLVCPDPIKIGQRVSNKAFS